MQRLVEALVLRMKPEVFDGQLPGLPAHIIFMCILYADHTENSAMLQGLLTSTITAIKSVVTQHASNLAILAFWISNGYRLMCNMKEFSKVGPGSKSNQTTSKVRLSTFDLSDYRMVISDLLVQIYHAIIHTMNSQLTSLVVPGLLEFEGIPNMTATLPLGKKLAGPKSDVTIVSIKDYLQSALTCFEKNFVEPSVVKQVFKQIFYMMNAVTVNNILLRKDFCNCFKGVQIRYNVTRLQEWAAQHKLDDVKNSMTETVQLCQILQIGKTRVQDVDVIYESGAQLNPLQIQKILTMYTPMDGEDRVPAAVIRAVVERGADRADPSKLMMDSSFQFPVVFPASVSSVDFAQVHLPPALAHELDFLEKI